MMKIENRAFTLGELKIISAANEEADQLEAELMDKIIETLEKRINAEAQVLHNHTRQKNWQKAAERQAFISGMNQALHIARSYYIAGKVE